MEAKEQNGMQCAEFDALLSQAIDGTLSGERLAAFEAHGAGMPDLRAAAARSRSRAWLAKVSGQKLNHRPDLVTNVLLRNQWRGHVTLSRSCRRDDGDLGGSPPRLDDDDFLSRGRRRTAAEIRHVVRHGVLHSVGQLESCRCAARRSAAS